VLDERLAQGRWSFSTQVDQAAPEQVGLRER
jgi:hypothetical protein